MTEELPNKDIPRPLFDFIYMSIQTSWGDKKQVNFTKLAKEMAKNFLERYPDTKDLHALAKNFNIFIKNDLKMSENKMSFTREGNKGTFRSHCDNCMICFTNKKLKEKYGPEGAGCWIPGLTMTLLKKIEPNISKIDWTVNEKPKTGECILEYEITFRN
ncbi:MAG: hypothetical protein ACTSRB_16190 [Candidatus Helarchaeota archaeon]